MKSGTTFLHNLLLNHPEVKIIERNMDYAYFDDDRIYKKGKKWYLSLFDDVKKYQDDYIIGQTSADCAFNPGSIDRILEHNPNIKLIFVLRHPIDRAYSLYWHQYSMGREYRTFEKAINKEPELIKKSYHNFKHYSYLERSKYKSQFETILNKIDSDNILFLDFVKLTKDTLNEINKALNFLNISEVNNIEELHFSKLPKNSARIPSNHFIVQLSAVLQNLKMEGLGRRLVNMFRVEKRPPKLDPIIRDRLEKELEEDIKFYNNILNK